MVRQLSLAASMIAGPDRTLVTKRLAAAKRSPRRGRRAVTLDAMEDGLTILQERTSALLADVLRSINEMKIIPRSHGAADFVLLALLSKLIRVSRSVVVLSLAGFGDEAFGLCRTSVEIELTIRWLTNKDTEQRCRRYRDYSSRNYVDLEKVYQTHISHTGIAPPKVLAEMRVTAEDYKEHRWWPTGRDEGGVKMFAYEPSTTEVDQQGRPSTEEFRYDLIYRMMSYDTHGVIGCLLPNHRPKAGEAFRIADGEVPSSHVANALRAAALSVLISVHRVVGFFNYSMPGNLQGRELDFMVASYKEEQS